MADRVDSQISLHARANFTSSADRFYRGGSPSFALDPSRTNHRSVLARPPVPRGAEGPRAGETRKIGFPPPPLGFLGRRGDGKEGEGLNFERIAEGTGKGGGKVHGRPTA